MLDEYLEFHNNLNEKYKRDDMQDIVNRYCEQIIKKKSHNDIAKNYVLDAEKDVENFNTGHILTAIMNSPEKYEAFEIWYERNYLTDKDINGSNPYKSIQDCIHKNFDSRMEGSIVQYIIQAGYDNLTTENVQEVLQEIDQRHDKYDEDNMVYFMSREFEKAIVKTGYLVTKNFTQATFLEYLTKDYMMAIPNFDNWPVTGISYFTDDGATYLKIHDDSNNALINDMTALLQNAIAYIENNSSTMDDDTMIYKVLNVDNLTQTNVYIDRNGNKEIEEKDTSVITKTKWNIEL